MLFIYLREIVNKYIACTIDISSLGTYSVTNSPSYDSVPCIVESVLKPNPKK